MASYEIQNLSAGPAENRFKQVQALSKTPNQKKAKQYNAQGMKHYRQKEYPQAVLAFQKAIEFDPLHKKANYNLACVYALLPNVCGELEALPRFYPEEVLFKQLKRAIEIDPHVKIKARKDLDFDRYRYSIRFLTIIEALPAPNDSEKWRKIVIGHKTFYTGKCSGGAYGCSAYIFNENGVFRFHDIYNECIFFPDRCTQESRGKLSGTYKVKGSRIILHYKNGDQETWGLPGQGYKKELLENNPDPCSA